MTHVTLKTALIAFLLCITANGSFAAEARPKTKFNCLQRLAWLCYTKKANVTRFHNSAHNPSNEQSAILEISTIACPASPTQQNTQPIEQFIAAIDSPADNGHLVADIPNDHQIYPISFDHYNENVQVIHDCHAAFKMLNMPQPMPPLLQLPPIRLTKKKIGNPCGNDLPLINGQSIIDILRHS